MSERQAKKERRESNNAVAKQLNEFHRTNAGLHGETRRQISEVLVEVATLTGELEMIRGQVKRLSRPFWRRLFRR